MNSDVEVMGMSPVIYPFMGKKRKLRNVTIEEDIDLEVITLELNSLPVPQFETTRTVEKTVNGKTVQIIEQIPHEEAIGKYKKDIKEYKKKAAGLRKKYLLALFDEGQITPEEIKQVTSREWSNLRKQISRQRYYDMGMTDAEIDEMEKTAMKGAAARGGFPNQEAMNE